MSRTPYYLVDPSIRALRTIRWNNGVCAAIYSVVFLAHIPEGSLVKLSIFGLAAAYHAWDWWKLASVRLYPAASVSVFCDEREVRVSYPDDSMEHKIRWEDVESVNEIAVKKSIFYEAGYRLSSSDAAVFVPLNASGYIEFLASLNQLGKLDYSEGQAFSQVGEKRLAMVLPMLVMGLVLGCLIVYYRIFSEINSVYRGELRSLVVAGAILVVAIAASYLAFDFYNKNEQISASEADAPHLRYAYSERLDHVPSKHRPEITEEQEEEPQNKTTAQDADVL